MNHEQMCVNDISVLHMLSQIYIICQNRINGGDMWEAEVFVHHSFHLPL
jgi:hypothetical protein